MERIIYSKYSNERDDEFKIRTSIAKDERDNLILYKTPLTEKAKNHVNNMYNTYKKLCYYYEQDILNINKCEFKEGFVKFEYLQGETLEKKLDDLIELDRVEDIINLIKYYRDKVTSIKEQKPFVITEDFAKVFGNVNLSNGLLASSVSNIDIIFSNIIINEKWNLIDYEWTFNFPVPINFTIYRAIFYYINTSSKRSELLSLELMKLLEISDNEIEQYEMMERNFQNYIIGNSLTSWEIYNNIHGKCYDVSYLIKDAEQNQIGNEVQIYYDYGEGFSESNSTKHYITPDDNGKVYIKIKINENIKQLRIDPANDYNIIIIEKFIGSNNNYYPLNYDSNGYKITEKTVLFITSDPQIYVNTIDPGTNLIELEYFIKMIPSELSLEFSKYVYSNENTLDLLKSKLNELDIKTKEFERNIDIRDEYIRNIQKSRLWKYYKKHLIKRDRYSEFWS